jgi:chromosome segregation ATPase
MPQIEEVQFVWWGPFRPDTVPLAVDGINVATGPNGSGKTAFLDGIKLLLGTDQLKAKPVDYIYVSGSDEEGEPRNRARRALLRAVFANPDQGGGRGRLFADAGRGCESAPYVTAICEVTRDRRRYTLAPGRLVWGGNGSDVVADTDALSHIPANHWLGPRKWQGLMARAGVTRSLLQLMSMAQGETDKAIQGTPEELLRRVLELTGRQKIINDFRETKKGLAAARASHREASERLSGEMQRLEMLGERVRRHHEYIEASDGIERIEKLELPVSRNRAVEKQVETVENERDGTARSVEALREGLAKLEDELPSAERRLKDHDQAAKDFGEQAAVARRQFAAASASAGSLGDKHVELEAAISAASTELKGGLNVATVESARRAAASAAASAERHREEIEATELEVATLTVGRPVPPDGLAAFRAALEERGIETELVAERLDADDAPLAEAALGDGLWALVVDPESFEEAVALAVEQDHHYPVVKAGAGQPDGAFAGATGLPEASAYLVEVGPPVEEVPGIDRRGLARGHSWATWRRPRQPVLGAEARRAALAAAEERLGTLRKGQSAIEAFATVTSDRAGLVRDGLQASEQIVDVESQLRSARENEARAGATLEELETKVRAHGEIRGRLDAELEGMREREERESEQLIQSGRRLETYEKQLEELSSQLIPLSPEQEGLIEVAGVEALERELVQLRGRLDDESRFPAEVRSEMTLVEHADQERRVVEVGHLLVGRERDLEAVGKEVERARQLYDGHVREVIGIVGRRFGELCGRAGMEGSLQLVPSGDLEDEMALEMKVAHVRGERSLSSRHPHHSGGQKVKMAILLLLASMGVEGATDLLIMDEHSAHLDSRNIDHVAELMNSLKEQVQFILAMPSHAEALRLSWCDHQLAFYLRSGEEPYTPPIRLLTRLPENGEAKYAEHMGQLPFAN